MTTTVIDMTSTVIDRDLCAVCSAPVEAAHVVTGARVATRRWCSADPSHNYGCRGVRR